MPVNLHPLSAWLDNVALGALSSRETVEASYRIARMAIETGIPGDFVECGVFGGAQSAAMARAIYEDDSGESDECEGHISTFEYSRNQPGHHRRVHLFDTFAGIPQAGPHDLEFQAAQHEAGLSSCSLESVKDHMREWSLPDELFVYHPGYFLETVSFAWGAHMATKAVFARGIAVLRLDGDLYESTRECLPLLDLVNPGGWIIVDDFSLSGARKAIVEQIGYPSPVYWQKGRA